MSLKCLREQSEAYIRHLHCSKEAHCPGQLPFTFPSVCVYVYEVRAGFYNAIWGLLLSTFYRGRRCSKTRWRHLPPAYIRYVSWLGWHPASVSRPWDQQSYMKMRIFYHPGTTERKQNKTKHFIPLRKGRESSFGGESSLWAFSFFFFKCQV